MKTKIEQLQAQLKYDQQRLEHQKALLVIERKNLDDAEVKAKAGLDTSTELENIVRDSQEKISEIKAKILNHETNVSKIQQLIESFEQERTSPTLEEESLLPATQNQIEAIPLSPSYSPTIEEEAPRDYQIPNRTRKSSKIFWVIGIILTISMIVILNIEVAWPWVWKPVILEMSLDQSAHHLGDNTYNLGYIESINGERIINLDPEGVNYKIDFSMRDLRKSANLPDVIDITRAEIMVTVNHLKPRQNAPVVLILNGTFQDFLNNFTDKEQFKRELITRRLNTNDILNGVNTILLSTGVDEEQDDYEDFEFYDLRLRVWFNYVRLNMGNLFAALSINILIGLILFIVIMKVFKN